MRSTITVALALAAGAHAVAVESESKSKSHVFGKGGAGVYRPPPPPSATGNAPPRLGKDGAGVLKETPPRLGKDGAGVLKDLDAKTIAAKFAWYVEQFEKTYDIEEYAERLKAFSVTLREIHQHEEDHKVGLNKFSDWTSDEFEAYQKYKPSMKRHAPQTHKTSGKPLPTDVDWRKDGLVADVKDQGSCGSCWTFSTVASIEGAHAKKYGKMVTLSEQNLVDCVKKDRLPSDAEDCCAACVEISRRPPRHRRDACSMASSPSAPDTG
jgi:hypothetical protein